MNVVSQNIKNYFLLTIVLFLLYFPIINYLHQPDSFNDIENEENRRLNLIKAQENFKPKTPLKSNEEEYEYKQIMETEEMQNQNTKEKSYNLTKTLNKLFSSTVTEKRVTNVTELQSIDNKKNSIYINYSIEFYKRQDLMVFLHIEKTGGTEFELKLVQNLTTYDKKKGVWRHACKYYPDRFHKYICTRDGKLHESNYYINNWLYCRPTFGWTCGVHADYTKFLSCFKDNQQNNEKKLIKGNFHYITILRDPVVRYVSEWLHVTRSIKSYNMYSPFNTSTNICNKEASMLECIPKKIEDNVLTLDDFTLCVNNIASNRQTRLLADYSDTIDGCNLFNPQNNKQLLKNAKKVLESLSFFGLTEYEELNQKLFEKTFQNRFKFKYNINPTKPSTESYRLVKKLNSSMVEKLKQLNLLDIELYKFARNLYFKRLNFFNISQ